MGELDILAAGLWEEARFARLPCDAPSELRDLVEDIENPKRVYSIHRATRRHNFQLLVQKFIVQIRDGCGAQNCSTPTCFTYRKRLAGRGPTRRYNTTSARALAIYQASQDNPENGLCPSLRPVKAPPAALNQLVFVPNPKPSLREDQISSASVKGKAIAGVAVSPKSPVIGTQSGLARTRSGSGSGSGSATSSRAPKEPQTSPLKTGNVPKQPTRPSFSVSEEPVSKDYRSFAANVFGSVAFKMLEWLTPAAIEDMFRKTQDLQSGLKGGQSQASNPYSIPENEPFSLPPQSLTHSSEQGHARKEVREKVNKTEKGPNGDHLNHDSLPSPRSGVQRHNSNTKVLTPSGSKPKHQLSIDPFATETLGDDPYSGLLKSPRANGGPTDKSARGLKSTSSKLSLPISQLSSAGFFDDVSLEKMPPPKPVDLKPKANRTQMDGTGGSESSSPGEFVFVSRSGSSNSFQAVDPETEPEDESELPQALSKLNVEVVDFICDVIQEDGAAEKHMLEPPSIKRFHTGDTRQGKPLKRKSRPLDINRSDLKLEWKLFLEQTLFYVLSNPELLIRSFTKKGQLYDSHTLWYCMLRMTRVAPKLVFDSLWMAAASLFAPPKSLQSLRSPTAKLFPKDEESLSNTEAGRLMSICLHALIAAAPVVASKKKLDDVSRTRAQGMILGRSEFTSQRLADPLLDICLQYEDAFSDDLALRLAKRLFAAISTRRYYDAMGESSYEGDGNEEPDVLAPLFSQLDFRNRDAIYICNFTLSENSLHEARVPILLLDWARMVMMSDWDGNPEVPGDGPFGGALALVETMHNKRHELQLEDTQFLSEFFGDRLDVMQMPTLWLSHTRTQQEMHLLDFPYLFNPTTLVTYFRSINFSRMARSFEEATSLQDKIEVVISRLSINRHDQNVLNDRLKTAESKYLMLEISRDNIVRDTFNQLWRREERELLKPIKVRLGKESFEEGIDSGGIQQEFFRVAIAEIMKPGHCIFTVDDRTRMAWFVPGSMEPLWKFELVGLLVSLAVYNGLTLPVTFPKALYRKILGEPVTDLIHIADGWPQLASSLTELLDHNEKAGLVEDIFCVTYEFSAEVFGSHVSREMKSPSTEEEWPQFPKTVAGASSGPDPTLGNPGPDDAPMVTSANRIAYVHDYIRYLTDVSVRPQFEAFSRGFRMCFHPKSLTLLSSNILQSLVEGVQDIDIAKLRKTARYVGYDPTDRVVKDFWSIVKRYDDNMKRKLLEFVTASDRVPSGGIDKLQFIIQRNGDGENNHLPTSYTCYGILLLPSYKDKEVLRQRLATALENSQGFGNP
ncbi:hypothetical protein B0T26DRAFT_742901 [Lasiosphaeria miniovina]|uniref:HECT-type E3 ubiquitin transferase n=1 Tax=Lasiosphaeria miniovina TaxID=1954250 RepID=A0AA40A5E3_9PEZI|nr:uncharacterized protein B0T26DRAFT_742901 [Lasiosphaeria miniovina]KAK0709468.1 hypothetical protein B0T26DRAFT_742901 [Lasiosphaeria miniovina]